MKPGYSALVSFAALDPGTLRALAESCGDDAPDRADERARFISALETISREGFGLDGLLEALEGEPLDRFCAAPGEEPPRSVDELASIEARFTPDRAQGVRINIAPFERAGLLGAPVLTEAEATRALADRARYRADERRLCRMGALAQPS